MGSGLMQVMEITDIERRLNQMREAQSFFAKSRFPGRTCFSSARRS